MILRKPYAFLIKYFKVINILMFVIFAYLVFPLRQIYVFCTDYVSNNSYMYFENMAQKYVPLLLFALVFLLLTFSVGIFFLMRKKEKPILFYKITIIYSFVLLIALIYFYIFFNSLSNTNYTPLRLVINRDIIMIIYYLNFLFVAFSFVRGFGFDIKKFSFDKDRRELKLEASDSEEYEVNIDVEKEDIFNYLKREGREFKYYFAENSKFYITVGIIIVLSLGLYFLYDHFVANKVYKENQVVRINNIAYQVSKSIITSKNKYGEEIDQENEYVVVFLNINNPGSRVTLNDQQFRVNVSEEYSYASVGLCNLFDDLGECFTGNTINGNANSSYIMVYKIPKKHNKIYFEILKSSKSYQYEKINLSYKNDYKEIINYNKNDVINIDNNEYQVTDYSFLEKAKYQYEECTNGKCNTYTKLISPRSGYWLLSVDISNLEKLSDSYLDNYIGFKYRNNILYGSSIEVLGRNKNTLYLSVPNVVHQEDKLILVINSRNKEYDILLKEGIYE